MKDEGDHVGGVGGAAAWKPARGWVIAKHVGRWGALVAGLAWPMTMLVGVTWIVTPGFRFVVYGGSFNTSWESPAPTTYPPGFYSYKNTGGAMWLVPSIETSGAVIATGPWSKTVVIMPLWMFAVALGCVGVAGTIKCRPPRMPWACRKCGYDLRGTPGVERCPECGAEVRKALMSDE